MLMRLPALAIAFILLCHFTHAQSPLIKQWDARFGGSNLDQLFTVEQTADGGFILGGVSSSDSSGDKTQDNWHDFFAVTEDYWVVKVDSLGNKQWDKRFGGARNDEFAVLKQTPDGGYILGGTSRSDSSGDKTQHSHWSSDYWVVKIDAHGAKEWDKRFGGSSDDELRSIALTPDGGYLLGGRSSSDSSGEKTQNSLKDTLWGWSNPDFWIVKIDSLGNKQWDKTLGEPETDLLESVQPTSDKGYILGGYTDFTLGEYADFFLIKIDSSGNEQWRKKLGSADSEYLSTLQQTSDGGYIAAGIGSNGAGGDKTETGRGGYDYWIIKTDSVGNRQWDKTFGGDKEEYVGSIFQNNRGYIVCGYSRSPMGGDKTEENNGSQLGWVVQMDSFGNKIWDKTIFNLSSVHIPSVAIPTRDGGLAVASTANNIGGGTGGYQTHLPRGHYDYWMVKFSLASHFTTPLNVSCFGEHDGSAAVTVLDGSPPYRYLWSTGDTTQVISHLSSGNYIVTVTGTNGFQFIDTAIVTQPLPLSFSSASQFNVRCYNQSDGSITATPAGGTRPYSMIWSNNERDTETIPQLAAGTYTVTLTDPHGCAIDTTFIITQPAAAMEATATILELPTCDAAADGAVVITVDNGTPPYEIWFGNHQVSDTIHNLPIGIHEITIIDFHWCDDEALATIPPVGLWNAGEIAGDDTVEVNEWSTFSTDTGYLYEWNVTGEANLSGQNNNSAQVQWTQPGTVNLQLIIQNSSCADTLTKSVTVIEPNGINDLSPDNILAYPNPTHNLITIYTKHSLAKKEVTLVDALGTVVYRQTFPAHAAQNIITLDFSALNPGVYFLQIPIDNFMQVKKVVKYD